MAVELSVQELVLLIGAIMFFTGTLGTIGVVSNNSFFDTFLSAKEVSYIGNYLPKGTAYGVEFDPSTEVNIDVEQNKIEVNETPVSVVFFTDTEYLLRDDGSIIISRK